jgi:hypothetical protein
MSARKSKITWIVDKDDPCQRRKSTIPFGENQAGSAPSLLYNARKGTYIMKKFLVLATAASFVAFTGCSKDDESDGDTDSAACDECNPCGDCYNPCNACEPCDE